MQGIGKSMIEEFRQFLINEEKSSSTLERYIFSVKMFAEWLEGQELSKQVVLEYKQYLMERYKTTSVNAAISAINCFMSFFNMDSFKVKTIKCQRELFCSEERELTRAEYERLLRTAHKCGKERIYHIMVTICSCGIRISELRFITVEAVNMKKAEVRCKGKNRTVFLPEELCVLLRKYIKKMGIKSGSVFVTKGGKPVNRSNIWLEMKRLCKAARVSEKKVFPHNLRHLFARTYYSMKKDISRLADILGHSSINTTRIYTVESGKIHRQQLESLGLVSLFKFNLGTKKRHN